MWVDESIAKQLDSKSIECLSSANCVSFPFASQIWGWTRLTTFSSSVPVSLSASLHFHCHLRWFVPHQGTIYPGQASALVLLYASNYCRIGRSHCPRLEHLGLRLYFHRPVPRERQVRIGLYPWVARTAHLISLKRVVHREADGVRAQTVSIEG